MTTTELRTLWRITVSPKRPQLDAHGQSVLRDIHDMGYMQVRGVGFSRLFLLEGDVTPEAVQRIGRELLADPVTETFTCTPGGDDPSLPGEGFDAAVEVHLKGGVMDVVAASTLMAIADMNLAAMPPGEAGPTDRNAGGLRLSTGRLYRIAGLGGAEHTATIAQRLLANDCIEDIYITAGTRRDSRPDRLPVAPTRAFELRHIRIRELDDAALAKLSREGHLFLSLDEMRTIQRHYRDLGREPTDLELETFAQTWSEHCVHKTLKSAVRYTGEPFPVQPSAVSTQQPAVEVMYGNLLRDTIARATRELIAAGKADWCLSVFEDNAGIIALDDQYGIAFKAETHNHPSAIEPYGGAATGIGGCIRDIMGCGLGAKPIANTDVFCVADPDFPADALPRGVLHPRRVLKGVVAGVRDYGNRMGIPTVNGAIVFDDRYLGNPLVFCGCIGLIPRDRIKKEPRPGDLVVVIGGRTGRDGIHGATFSSAELTDTHADEFSHAVQIGNAITQKKVLDAQLAARDYPGGCLYTAVTDCGAGGLSSAVGEMGATLGASVDLEKVPLKYSGLRYDEIWISEAQERMVFSVPPANWLAFKQICDAENVEATAIGEFRNDGRLVLRYAGTLVGEVECSILHDGIPKTRREATWQAEPAAQARGSAVSAANGVSGEAGKTAAEARNSKSEIPDLKSEIRDAKTSDPASLAVLPVTPDTLRTALRSLNAASKEWVIRQYDHEVQGGSVIKPLVGPGQGPSDAAVIRPVLGSDRGVAIANGICPHLSDRDPYWMAVAAIDEAIRNVVCVGGDPSHTAILDNFCWGNCDDPQNMGALVRACQACYDAAMAHGTPFISGKDSLNNEFAIDPADAARLAGRIPLVNNRIRIPGTLLVSAISLIDDVNRCITMDAKVAAQEANPLIFAGLRATSWQAVSLADAAKLHTHVAGLIASGQVLAAHDVSESGILPAAAEMLLAGRCGAHLDLRDFPLPLLGALTSGYVLQIREPLDSAALRGSLGDSAVVAALGALTAREQVNLLTGDGNFTIQTAELAAAWRDPLHL